MSFTKYVTLRPVLLVELVLVVMLAAGGAALAFTNGSSITDDTSTNDAIQYEQTIGNSDITVTDYAFTYDAGMDNITAVTGTVSGTSGDKCYVTADLGTMAGTHQQKTSSLVTFSAATASFTCTFDSAVAVGDVTQLHLLVEKTHDAG
jgi:hypothetical protein